MVKMGAGSVRGARSGKQASRVMRREEETSGGAALSVGLASMSVSASVPPAEDRSVEETLPLAPVSPGRAASVEEEEDAVPPLKRKRVAGLGDLPSSPTDQSGKRAKGKGKAVVTQAGHWETTLKLSKDASIGDLEVARYLAERVTLPVDERVLERKNSLEMGSQLIRLGMRVATGSSALLQRLETLDREVQNLHEQVRELKDELSEVKERRDLLQAQNISLEERNASLEERLARVEGERELERKEREVERIEKEKEMEDWKRTVREERELIKVLRRDCQSAAEGRARAEEVLKEMQCSVKRQRIEAIKRWKRRYLYDESLELGCDAALSVLKRGYQFYIPEGSQFPSFEEYARPLIPPALGVSLEEMVKRAAGELTEVPDEELDLSSEEGECHVENAPSSPSGPTSALVVMLDDEEPLAAFSGPAPLPLESPPPLPTEPPHSEASPGRSHASEYSPGYSPSLPANH